MNPDQIITAVTRYFNVPKKNLITYDRHKEIAWARQVTAYCLYLFTDLTMKEIGKLLKRDHSTIVVSVQDIKHTCRIYEDKRNEIIEIETLLECK